MTRSIPIFSDRELLELRNATPLLLQFSPEGGILAQRYEGLLLNQIVPDPYAQGLFRLVLRELSGDSVVGHHELAGPGVPVALSDADSICWKPNIGNGLEVVTQVQSHPSLSAWMWSLTITNTSVFPRSIDAILAQDIGLGDEAAVSNNEAYNSHYIDLNPLHDPKLGWVVMARQNQPTATDAHPVLAVACLDGARAYCTDGRQFFGPAHRINGEPAAFSLPVLPSHRLQYECAMACLQSHLVTLQPNATMTLRFVLRFVPDHPSATGSDDLKLFDQLTDWSLPQATRSLAFTNSKPSLFIDSPCVNGDEPSTEDWATWFPEPRRHEECMADGRLLSFFHGAETHVVSRLKEADSWRPHGHILRSGCDARPDPAHLGMTCYAAGVFAAQIYLGNPSLCQFVSVVRDQLGVLRTSGQRVFVRRDGRWVQLDLPSAFAMTPRDARWLYRIGDAVIELRVWCSADRPASFFEINSIEGEPCEFLISHRLGLEASGDKERACVDFDVAQGTARIVSGAGDVSFALCVADTDQLERLGGDECVQDSASQSCADYIVVQTRPTSHFSIVMTGTAEGSDALNLRIAEALTELGRNGHAALPAPQWQSMRLDCPGETSVGRVDEILPWFNHDAWIHFSAPHGLEQSGGGAWGVRDVCQGSMEWLLSTGRYDVAREVLCEVFRQQYAQDGEWPQWFMLHPHEDIRQRDSHGDVMLWPVKALCLYVERSNDTSILSFRLPYTDAETLQPTNTTETLLEHCDRVVARLRERLLPGTALVNYGNGDWDDTLQPADPSLRTKMVSAWTVGLAYQTLGQLARVCAHLGDAVRELDLQAFQKQMRKDFRSHLLVDGTVAGFLIRDGAHDTLLLHPRDDSTGVHYRLIPMTRGILSGLFDPAEARNHLELIKQHLLFPDGVRLMSTPVPYLGGEPRFFKRAETAANVGREIGLMYVHAHLRYAAALARVGDADGLWHALQLVNPVGLQEILPQAEPRQANVFFSSSDADFDDRYEAARRWEELRKGQVPVRGGWRLYSSGPGLFINLVRSSLLGIRESFGDVVFDPVLPRALNGLSLRLTLLDCAVTVNFSVGSERTGTRRISVNGTALEDLVREDNPYRAGGLRVPVDELQSLFTEKNNTLTIEL